MILLLLSLCSSSTLLCICFWQAGCPPQGKDPRMIERRDIQQNLRETLGSASSGFGLCQEIKLLGILFIVRAHLQERSQGRLLALCGGTLESSPQCQLGTALLVTSRFGSWSLQSAETFPSKKWAAGGGYAGTANVAHAAPRSRCTAPATLQEVFCRGWQAWLELSSCHAPHRGRRRWATAAAEGTSQPDSPGPLVIQTVGQFRT